MDILTKLFGSAVLVKVMRLFLFHPDESYDAVLVKEKTKSSIADARWALGVLAKIGFVKKKVFWKTVTVGKRKSQKTKKKRANGWVLDASFVYIRPLRDLLMNTELLTQKELQKKLRKAGTIKLLLIAGVLMHTPDSHLDLLVVGNKLNMTTLRKVVAELEAEIGTELRYAVFDTDEFKYRMGVNDKLLRDAFDYEHQLVINTLGV